MDYQGQCHCGAVGFRYRTEIDPADWSVRAFPTYYVLDSEQRIKRRDIGYSTQLGLLWRSWAVK